MWSLNSKGEKKGLVGYDFKSLKFNSHLFFLGRLELARGVGEDGLKYNNRQYRETHLIPDAVGSQTNCWPPSPLSQLITSLATNMADPI